MKYDRQKVRGKFEKLIGKIDITDWYWEESLFRKIIESALIGMLNDVLKDAAENGASAQILPAYGSDIHSALAISVDLPFGPEDDEPCWQFEFEELLKTLLTERPHEIDAAKIHRELQQCVDMVKKHIDENPEINAESESPEEKPNA